MTGIILVHGAWFGGWIWHRLSPILRDMGYSVIDGDLPGIGLPQAEKEQVTMHDQLDQMDLWTRKITGPVHLVGHGMSARIVTEFAERCTDRVASVTYISSLFGAPGEAAITMPFAREPDSRIKFTTEGELVPVTAEDVAKLAFSDCTPADFAVFAEKMERISWDPPMIPLDNPTGHWQRIQRAYIICRENPFVFQAQQHQMALRHKCDPIIKMNTGHCPFLTQPDLVAEHLDDIIRRVDPQMDEDETRGTDQRPPDPGKPGLTP